MLRLGAQISAGQEGYLQAMKFFGIVQPKPSIASRTVWILGFFDTANSSIELHLSELFLSVDIVH